MVSQLYNLDAPLFWAVLILIGIVVAAWSLRIACRICSVDPPDFLPAVVAMIVVCVANALWNYYLQISHIHPSLGTHLVVPLILTVVLLAMSLSTGLGSALMIASVQSFICGAFYLALTIFDGLVLAAPMVTTNDLSSAEKSRSRNRYPVRDNKLLVAALVLFNVKSQRVKNSWLLAL